MKKVIAPIVIILIALGLSAAMVLLKEPPAKKAPPDLSVLVETVALARQDVSFEIPSQGNITPRTETTLISEISGVVLEVSDKFVAGGFFKSGEILLKLDPTDYEVAVQQAQANLLGMQAKLTRERALAEQAKKEWDLSGKARSEAPLLALRTPFLEEAKANLLSAEADLKKAKRKLRLTTIRAPYDGMVKEKLADIGQYVSTGTPLATTFAVDFAEVRLPLTDNDIAYIDLPKPEQLSTTGAANGPAVQLTSVIGGREYHWSAHIVRTEGVIDQRTRVHYAVARIADPYGLNLDNHSNNNSGNDSNATRPPLSIGSFVKARIHGRLVKDIIAVPHQAVRGMEQVLMMDSEGRLRIRRVNILHADGKFVYIRDGIAEDDRAIITAVEDPVDGMRVRGIKAS